MILRPVIVRIPNAPAKGGPRPARHLSTNSATHSAANADRPRGPAVRALQQEYSRKAIAECARRMGLPRTGWSKDGDGRPMPLDGAYWSVSHKPHYAAAVIADAPVGIDVEQLLPRRDESLFDAVATSGEWSAIGERSWESFFRLWTAKEAVLKANGVGIGGLPQCRLAGVVDAKLMTLTFEDRSWPVAHTYFDGHVVAVTTLGRAVEWRTLPTV
ncbi:MAG: 4'-phosphopantetheinyl transferase superfamily protein [Planctomycetes bacterium]|nr:4'-phosphopantetheinyl transferase superfamily protein [Planctomycetota bacterium]